MRITVPQLHRIIKEEVSNMTQAAPRASMKTSRNKSKFFYEYPPGGKTMKLGQFDLSFYKETPADELWVNFDHPDLGSGNEPAENFQDLIDQDVESYEKNLAIEWEQLMVAVEQSR